MLYNVKYKHWKTDDILEVEGYLDSHLNNPQSERIVLKLQSGEYEDIIKDTIVEMEKIEWQ